MSNIPEETNNAAIYNVLIYLDHYLDELRDGITVKEVLESIKDIEEEKGIPDTDSEQLKVIENYIKDHPEVGNSEIYGHRKDDEVDGSAEIHGMHSFVIQERGSDGKKGDIIVVYRGTDSGEWLDNGNAMSGVKRDDAAFDPYSSVQQEKALAYFEEMASKYKWTKDDHIIVSGHSKGGNKAQYVSMYSDLADKCISLNGQGFSPEEIQFMKEYLGEDEFNRRVSKLYSVSEENDYVNVLGIRLVPPDNITFLKTNKNVVGKNPAYNHFAHANLTADGQLTDPTGQGPISKFVELCISQMMELDPSVRDDPARAVMMLLQIFYVKTPPLYGDKASGGEMVAGTTLALCIILKNLLTTQEGRELLAYLGKEYIPVILDALDKKLRDILPGYAIVSDKLREIMIERGITSIEELFAYIGEDPLWHTLDLVLALLSDIECVMGLIAMTAVIGFIVAVLAQILPFLIKIFTAAAKIINIIKNILVIFMVVKLVIDYLAAHWDEIIAAVKNAIEYITDLANKIIEHVMSTLAKRINALIDSAVALYEWAKGEFLKSIHFIKVAANTVMEVISRAYRIVSTICYTAVRSIAGVVQNAVWLQIEIIQDAVDHMDRLAARVRNIDTRLDSIFWRLCNSMIEEQEGVFTSLANLYNIGTADLAVDEGGRIRRMANNIASLYNGYMDVEKWVMNQL